MHKLHNEVDNTVDSNDDNNPVKVRNAGDFK